MQVCSKKQVLHFDVLRPLQFQALILLGPIRNFADCMLHNSMLGY